MKKLFLLFILTVCTAYSQSFSVFDVDASNFPTIKAKFYAFDKDGNQITNLSASDFEVKENGQPREVTYVSCPPVQPPQALSSVLTIDVSGSMVGQPLENAKAAGRAWVEGLALGKSECALTTFNSGNYYNQDFTTDKNKLLNAINSLNAYDGTDFDAGFINTMAGALLAAEKGKHKKVVVFLTDGLANGNESAIIQKANSINATVFCVTLNMPCPQILKNIAEQTGGQWFENITTKEQAEDVFRKILLTAQGGDPCEIEWQSGASCWVAMTNVEVKLIPQNVSVSAIYQTPSTSVAKLEFKPTTVKFADPVVGVLAEQKVTVIARNADFTVKSITCSNAAFDINPKSFVLKAGKSIELTVSYLPSDSGYVFARFEIENAECPQKLFARGGWKEIMPKIKTLKLIHPNGGEEFVVGSDTVITWEGVLPDEPVKIEYSIDNGVNWITITDSAKNFSYKWRVPKTPSNQCLARVTATVANSAYSTIGMVFIPADTFQMGNTGTYLDDFPNEQPVHTVTISRDFLMSKTEITQKQYEVVIGTNPSNCKGENLPVETVSWYDAVVFCNKLSEIEGLEKCYTINGTDVQCDWNAIGYRLPTEAEWEYAAKAGTTTDFYSGNMTYPNCTPLEANLDKIAWYCGNEYFKTREVGQKEPNAFGLYDMNGNVWEWCWDWNDSYSSSTVTDPLGPLSGTDRVVRGGSWYDNAWMCRSAHRLYNNPDARFKRCGLRIVRTY